MIRLFTRFGCESGFCSSSKWFEPATTCQQTFTTSFWASKTTLWASTGTALHCSNLSSTAPKYFTLMRVRFRILFFTLLRIGTWDRRRTCRHWWWPHGRRPAWLRLQASAELQHTNICKVCVTWFLNFWTSYQCCGSGSESESVKSVCFWASRISRPNLTAYFQRLTLSPLVSHLLGLLSLFKEWQTLPLSHVGPVSDPSHPQTKSAPKEY